MRGTAPTRKACVDTLSAAGSQSLPLNLLVGDTVELPVFALLVKGREADVALGVLNSVLSLAE